jgi:TIGR03009 family protein
MRYSWLALVGVVALGGGLQAQQPAPQAPAVQTLDLRNPLDALLLQWEQSMQKVGSLSAELNRVKVDPAFRSSDTFKGTAVYQKPDLALLHLQKVGNPNVYERYVCTGTFIYEYHYESKEIRYHQLPAPKPGQVADDNFLSFLFGMKADEAKRRYELKLVGDPNDKYYYYVLITPRFPVDKAEFQSARLALTKSGFLPRQLTFRETNGAETTWDIPKIETGVQLNRNLFTKPTLPFGWKYAAVPQANDNVKPRLYRPNQ